jgi:hypothetical protein
MSLYGHLQHVGLHDVRYRHGLLLAVKNWCSLTGLRKHCQFTVVLPGMLDCWTMSYICMH